MNRFNTLLADQAQAEAAGKECLVGAVIINPQGRVLVQKRSAERRLYPNCWDIIGGHVDPGESLFDALRREIREETGWELARIVTLIDTYDWETEQNVRKREFDFVVEVAGDLEHPRLEWPQHSEFRWIGPDEIEIMNENHLPGDNLLYQVVKRGLQEFPGQVE